MCPLLTCTASIVSVLACPRLQVYYPVAPEVYRDLLWEDVDVADPVEYTFCRYTPITTEVTWGRTGWVGLWAVCLTLAHH